MTAAQLTELLRALHRPGREDGRLEFYRSLERYLIKVDHRSGQSLGARG